ncbi:MAG: ion transporter [Hungatella sp.]
MRQRIYQIIEKTEPGDRIAQVYDIFITAVSVISLVPLMFKETTPLLYDINNLAVYLLFMDYVLRFMVHDYKRNEIGDPWAFVKYPLSPWAICDILAIFPTLGLLGKQFKMLRAFRIVKIMHYSKSFTYVSNVLKKEKQTLVSVLVIAVAYIFISALIMFCYEPDTFEDFFESLYWATTALTTVGYGDIYPVSIVGRLISMISSVFGIAVIALPAGVVTSGFMNEMTRDKEERELAKAVAKEAAKSAVKDAEDDTPEDAASVAAQSIMEAAKRRAVEVAEGIADGETPEQIQKGEDTDEQ